MSLNIKNERVHDLAREAARRTGRTQTGVIQLALEQLLDTLGSNGAEAARRQRLDDLMAEVRRDLTDGDRASMQRAMDEMYDESGLPT